MYLLLLAIIYLAFISLGLPDSLIGSAWPVMHQDLGVSIESMGILTMLISAGTILSSLFSERIIHKLGTYLVTSVSVILTAGALLGYSLSTQFWQLCLWAIPYGIGAGCIDAALNNYIALYYKAKHMSWLHCFWGVGTIISPYIMSLALSLSHWSRGFQAVAGIQFLIALVVIGSFPLWKKKTTGEEGDANEHEVLGIRRTLLIHGVVPQLIAFFAYCSAEATCMYWASSFLVESRHIGEERAAAYGALFFIGMTVGRFISGFFLEKVGSKNIIRIGATVGFVGMVLLALPIQADVFSLLAFVVMGLGCAPIYPAIMHATPQKFGATQSQAIIGVQMACAYAGTTLMPPAFGVLARWMDMRIMPVFLGVFFVLMLVTIEVSHKMCQAKIDK